MSSKPFIEKLNKKHNLSVFNCGVEALNSYLQKYALNNQNCYSSTTYLAIWDNRVVAYYTIAISALSLIQAPERVSKGMPKNYPIPIVILGRLAVDENYKNQGLGKGLIKDVVKKNSRDL